LLRKNLFPKQLEKLLSTLFHDKKEPVSILECVKKKGQVTKKKGKKVRTFPVRTFP